MADDLRVDRFTVNAQRLRRALFVRPHEPTVAGRIGSEDCNKAALDTIGHMTPSL